MHKVTIKRLKIKYKMQTSALVQKSIFSCSAPSINVVYLYINDLL